MFTSRDRHVALPCFVFIAATLAAAAQTPPRDQSATQRTGKGVIRGRAVRASDNRPLPPYTFVSARETEGPFAYGQTATGIARGDGSFAIAGLLPGTYLIEARSSSAPEFASTEVVVDGGDVVGLSLILSSGATARGRIRFDIGRPPDGVRPSDVLIGAALLGQHHVGTPGGPPSARDDWSFEVQGLRGRGFIRAGTLTDWQMRSVHLAGVDVTDTALDFRDGNIDGLEIELTQRRTTVSGTVSDGRGAVLLDATVVVFAEDREKWGPESRFIWSARPDQQGRFTLDWLPPARYLAIAVGYLEPGEERDPELLDMWRQNAAGFTLAEGEARALTLTLSGF